MHKNLKIVPVLVLAAACSGTPRQGDIAPPLDPSRKVSEQDCTRQLGADGGNLMCRQISEAERRARIAEEERLARERREAAERAERERLERERAEQLAREEALRKQRAAEEERLAAERRRLEEEAARKAQEERERRERAEAEARAKREAAARECRRLEQERLDGRALLENFVANYGRIEENKAIAAQISAFLARPSRAKPCPPA
jgi:hypothetical protein